MVMCQFYLNKAGDRDTFLLLIGAPTILDWGVAILQDDLIIIQLIISAMALFLNKITSRGTTGLRLQLINLKGRVTAQSTAKCKLYEDNNLFF